MQSLVILPFTLLLVSSFPMELTEPEEPKAPMFQIPNPEPTHKYYQGDIILNEEEEKMVREKRGAPDVTDPNRKWPTNQVISYKIDAAAFDANTTRVIRDAFKFWTDNSCLTYQENGPTSPFLRVFKGGACASTVGRAAGAVSQDINLGNGCNNPGTLQHEIAHSMGLEHTQSRFDRDSYVTLNPANIDQAYVSNFNLKTAATNNNFGVPYDYSSVLHYGGNDFAIDATKPTMIAKDSNAQFSMGQRDKAAFSDIVMVNAYYECAKKCPSPAVKCQNGGIINSKTCNTCICPFMFAGADCSQRHTGRGFDAGKSSCGADLTATSSWQNLQGSVGDYNGGQIYKENLSDCFWNIKAPAGRKIEVRLNNSGLYCQEKCYWNGIELFMRGFTVGGYRFCCMDKVAGKVIQSMDNLISVRGYSTALVAPFNVDYRFV